MPNSLATQKNARRPFSKSQSLSNHSPKKKVAHRRLQEATAPSLSIIFDINGRQICLQSADAKNIISYNLCEWSNSVDKKTGKIQGWTPFKYYSSLENAINAIFDFKVMASTATTLAELQNDIKHIRRELVECYETNLA